MYRKRSVCVVVPAYNECEHILDVIRGIPDYVDHIVAVDDASRDGTHNILEKAMSKDNRVVLIRHESNMGVGASITDGYQKSIELGAQIVSVMAGDGQMDPDQLPKLLDAIIDCKADYAKGNRLLTAKDRQQMPAFRKVGNAILSFLTKFCTGYWDIIDPQNGYTAITDHAIKTIDLEAVYPGYGYPNDLLVKLNVYGFRVVDVTIPARYGTERSKIRLWSYIPIVSILLLKGFLYRIREKYAFQSLHPLVFFYFLGFTMLPAGIILSAYMIYLRLATGGITASSAMIPLFLITMGLQSVFFAMLFDQQAKRA